MVSRDSSSSTSMARSAHVLFFFVFFFCSLAQTGLENVDAMLSNDSVGAEDSLVARNEASLVQLLPAPRRSASSSSSSVGSVSFAQGLRQQWNVEETRWRQLNSDVDLLVTSRSRCPRVQCLAHADFLLDRVRKERQSVLNGLLANVTQYVSRCKSIEISDPNMRQLCVSFFERKSQELQNETAKARAAVTEEEQNIPLFAASMVLCGLTMIVAAAVFVAVIVGWRLHVSLLLAVMPILVFVCAGLRMAANLVSFLSESSISLLVAESFTMCFTTVLIALFAFSWISAFYDAFSPSERSPRFFAILFGCSIALVTVYSIVMPVINYSVFEANILDVSLQLHSTFRALFAVLLVVYSGKTLAKLRSLEEANRNAVRSAAVLLTLNCLVLALCVVAASLSYVVISAGVVDVISVAVLVYVVPETVIWSMTLLYTAMQFRTKVVPKLEKAQDETSFSSVDQSSVPLRYAIY